jgi:hypothetical protein
MDNPRNRYDPLLPLSLNIEDRRNEYDIPSRAQILRSLIRGILSPPPPPLNRVETWTGNPNQQYGDTRLPPLGSNTMNPYAGIPSAPPLGR